MRQISILAVAALAATAMSFPAHQAQAYCRGCAVGTSAVENAVAGAIVGNAIANAQNGVTFTPPPPPPGIAPADLAPANSPNDAMGSATCHVQKQQSGTGRSWSTADVCE